MKLDWLIIGGGIHGAHIAARLLAEGGVGPEQLRIIDPGERLLERWRACTEATGMKHLRSPAVHHLALHPWSLKRFAARHEKHTASIFARPYDRPALALFNDHCDHVIESFGLANLHIQARATACSIAREGVNVTLSNGSALGARHIVLALGASEQPEWPDWATRGDARVHHIFDPEFQGWPSSSEVVAVVGGGISAGQIALRLLAQKHRVHLISRHALRKHQFDSDPGWLGPKFMVGFSRVRDVDRRRELIGEARHQGSVPPDIYRALRRAIVRGHLTWHEGEVEVLDTQGADLQARLANRDVVRSHRMLLATGFASRRPGGAMLDQLIESASLPCARCGYPIVDTALRWHPRVHVSGPLAELELGPAARNIAGARRAGDRLVEVAASSLQRRAS